MSFVTYSKLGKMGQLGNQMFQIASTIGIASKNSMFYAFPDWSYQQYFANPLPNSRDFIEAHKTPFKTIKEDAFTFEETELDTYYNYDILGYRQSWKYWEPLAKDLILKYFEFDKKVLDKVNKVWYKILLEKPVSVHVRMKDYLEFSEYHTNLHLTDYYKDAVKLLEGQNFNDKPIKYIIFSDDIEWCKTNIVELLGNGLRSDNLLFSQDQDEVADMALMSLCSHSIIANSTFSWWGAYLNKNEFKIVISPNGLKYSWFGKKLLHDTKDLIPKDWCKL